MIFQYLLPLDMADGLISVIVVTSSVIHLQMYGKNVVNLHPGKDIKH